MSNDKTKNDIAWEALFHKYKILQEIKYNGFYEIESKKINEFRESRLMAKFDHYINLPKLFKQYKLSILPITRNKYVIGNFNTYHNIKYNNIAPIPVNIPMYIESIDYTDLYSESAALHFAYNSGLIDIIMGQKSLFTVSGRMSSNNFDFNIMNSINNHPYKVNVKNSQIEIDAGFETQDYFAVVEAKNFTVDDILVRQLYYPYRLWSSKINKQVIPIFMTFSQDIFSFFIFKFDELMNYNSLRLMSQQDFIISPEVISLGDIIEIYENVKISHFSNKAPFPQANSFVRVLDLIGLLFKNDLTREKITENYEFDVRQTNYYTDAGRYLGLIKKIYENKEIVYTLTNEAKNIMEKKYKAKYLSLVKKILEQDIFYEIFKLTLQSGDIPDKNTIIQVMINCGLSSYYNLNTIDRRSTTVVKWIEWILDLIE